MNKIFIFVIFLNSFIFALSDCQMKYEYTSSTRKSNIYEIPINGAKQSRNSNYIHWNWTGKGESYKLTLFTINKAMKIKVTQAGGGCWGTTGQWNCNTYYKWSDGTWPYEGQIKNVSPGDAVYIWTENLVDHRNSGSWVVVDWEEIQETMTYYTHSCKNEANNQGFNWEIKDPGGNCYIDSGDKYCSPYNPTGWGAKISSSKNCRRQYQECLINCTTPLTLDTSSGKCVMSYETDCEQKGMIYDITLDKCVKENQCNNPLAQKDENSDYCIDIPKCNVVDGICAQSAIKYCDLSNFNYLNELNRCESETGCNSNQILLDNGVCGSNTYCNQDDQETLIDCINTVDISKTCAPDSRDNNICYKKDTSVENINIDYQRPLTRVDINGSFKGLEYGDMKATYCSNDDGNCTFRLTKIYTQNDGSELCFVDHVGGSGCIKINGDCKLSGEIEFDKGIRQLFIENNNKSIVAYNKAIQENQIGIIHSTCSLSGKVGSIDESSKKREIIAASANGIDIIFWDSYRRGNIGLITFLPTIPDNDVTEGFSYEEPDVMRLYNKGYTGFYTSNGATYAVYNGLISKDKCLSDINGTSFFIPQAENEIEQKILNMLNILGENQYNFNNANENNGSCVIKSLSASSFNTQYYSKKTVQIANANTRYVCSALKCSDNSCQYNQCPTNFIGNIIETSDFNNFLQSNYPQLNNSEICTEEVCDSKQPYYPYCGNNNGCKSSSNIFQQSDGKCIEVGCDEDEVFDKGTGKCIKLDCKDSVKKDGKCFKTLEL